MAYDPPKFKTEITLQLSRNESACAIAELGKLDSELVRQYPDHQALQELIGQYVNVDHERIVVTAGGDDAIERVMRTLISDQRKQIVTHAPTFEMLDIYSQQYGGELKTIVWIENDFPVTELVEKIDSQTALVVITSPNNPTGTTVSTESILQINEVARRAGARMLVDNAYVEFADEDPTAKLTADPNIMIVRTFSKAWGMAGLRVGYLIAPNAQFATTIRNASGPFPVSHVSLETARQGLSNHQQTMQANVATIKTHRKLVNELIASCGGTPLPSQGNFVLARFEDIEKIWAGLAEDGIAVRKFIGNDLLTNYLRITCPALPADFLQLAQSLCRIANIDFENQKVALGQVLKPDNVITSADSESQPETSAKDSNNAISSRTWNSKRETKETRIEINLNLDGTGKIEIETGIGFLDHMLTALAFHAGMDLKLKCVGDLHVDDHHTAEDCALALGAAIDNALGVRTGIKRFGYAYAPLDESLARTVIDLSGRPWPEIHLQLEREMIGQWACENIVHFFQSLAMTLKCSLHVDVLRGTNDHHRAEAAFKSCAKALKEAFTPTTGSIPSTKGVL